MGSLLAGKNLLFVFDWAECWDWGEVALIKLAEFNVREASAIVREDSLFSLSDLNDLLDFCLEKASPIILLSWDCRLFSLLLMPYMEEFRLVL